MTLKKQSNSNWIGAAAGAATGLISMLGQRKREKRALKNQKDLMGLQLRNQQALNKQGHQLQLDMWEKTNYPAQMKMLREAGLNPGLLYGQSGGGGTTTGSQGGGSAASGNAPSPQPMELGTALQAALTQSQIKLAESQAEKNKAEASSILGEEGTIGSSQIKSNLAEALNKETMAKLHQLSLEIGQETKQDQIDKVFHEVEGIIKNNNLTDEQILLVQQNVAATAVKMQLDKANINLSQQQAKKIADDIIRGWKELDAKLLQITVQNDANKLRGLEGQADIQRIKNNFILGVLGKEIDLHKLNIEQQRIFATMFNGILKTGTEIYKSDNDPRRW
jgi:hypothetical protein